MRTFKIFMAVAMVAVAAMSIDPAFAQADSRREQKEQIRTIKRQQDDFYKKSPKLVRKTAKQWKREGWQSMGLPIEKQLDETWGMQALRNDDGYYKYIVKESYATGTNFSAAQMQAENVAKVRIASEIAASVASLADIALANNESTPEMTASLSKAVENTKIIVSQKLGRVITGVSVYRKTRNGYEVRVNVLYDQKQAMEIAHQAIVQELKNESDENRRQLEAMMGLDKIQEQYKSLGYDEEL